jgi:hypothetical protein
MSNITSIHKDVFHCHQYSKTNTTFWKQVASKMYCLFLSIGDNGKNPPESWWYIPKFIQQTYHDFFNIVT